MRRAPAAADTGPGSGKAAGCDTEGVFGRDGSRSGEEATAAAEGEERVAELHEMALGGPHRRERCSNRIILSHASLIGRTHDPSWRKSGIELIPPHSSSSKRSRNSVVLDEVR